jgi:hypothetical protein
MMCCSTAPMRTTAASLQAGFTSSAGWCGVTAGSSCLALLHIAVLYCANISVEDDASGSRWTVSVLLFVWFSAAGGTDATRPIEVVGPLYSAPALGRGAALGSVVGAAASPTSALTGVCKP